MRLHRIGLASHVCLPAHECVAAYHRFDGGVPQVLTVASLLQYAGMFFVGMLPYAFLPIADTFFPQQLSWGDCSTLQGFWHHFRRGGMRSCAVRAIV
jgi:hypothetical protein